MRVEQRIRDGHGWTTTARRGGRVEGPQLALAFASPDALRDAATWKELRAACPGARIVGCSTAGEIAGTQVLDDSVVLTAVELDDSRLRAAAVGVGEAADARAIGARLAAELPHEGLVHVLVLSDGLKVNGSALVAGLVGGLPPRVAVTGGLSGDGAKFGRTAVCLDGPDPSEQVVAIGLYGERLRVGYGSLGGWDPFGPERRITRSDGNVLYELDGEPALALYKRYLAEHAPALPASGLLFPLAVRHADQIPVVRTILAVSEADQSLTFAGDVPVGHRARLMKANFDRLLDGASGAARTSFDAIGSAEPDLAILISCVGRRLVLKQRIEEEVEGVRDVLGAGAVLTGFYSYGEISPFTPSARCELHNQTMTITTLAER